MVVTEFNGDDDEFGDDALIPFDGRPLNARENAGIRPPADPPQGGVVHLFAAPLTVDVPEIRRPAPGLMPTIRLRAGALHQIASDAEAALLAAAIPIYIRTGEMVRPIIEEVTAFKGRRTKIARLRSISVDMLRDQLSRAARWERYDARSRKWVPADPPPDVAKTILARDGDWRFRQLTGIITTPTLRPDGSILSEAGYDAATALLLVDPPSMPMAPTKPSREDALAALELLDDLVSEFPFVSPADRSVALSALITPVVRGAMQVAPMHAFTAPEAGTGKSYVVDLAAALATGEIAPVIAAGRNEEETEKRLAAELMTAQPIVSIDNLNGDLGGDFVCQAIERPVVKPARARPVAEPAHREHGYALRQRQQTACGRRRGPARAAVLARRQHGAAGASHLQRRSGRQGAG